MNKPLKRTLSIILSTLILLSVFAILPTTASAATTSGDYEYTLLDDGTAEITDYTGEDTELTIPDTLDGYTVTSIGEDAFRWCTSLTSVVIPDNVTNIADQAFYGCTELFSVNIGNSVKKIGFGVFSNCSNLSSIVVSENNNNYTIVDGVLFNKDVTELVFYPTAKNNTSYIIPSSVTSIGYEAFFGCANLTSITIPSGVTEIGTSAFYSCSNLTSVIIPSGVKCMERAFYGCTSLESATISNDVTSIDYETFAYCTSLTSITIPTSVTTIESEAFFSCTSLTSIIIPDSVTSIGLQAFDGTAYSRDQSNWVDGILYLDNYLLMANEDEISSSTSIKKGTTLIADYAFRDCTSLTSVTIPDSVASIGSNSFAYCDNITSITIPDSVTNIGDSAFRDCTSLTSVTLGTLVTNIGDSAFYFCSALKNLTIGNSVTSIGEGAFWYCTSLEEVTLPNSVKNIKAYAFRSCTSLTAATIPASVTSIESSAFSNCDNLTIYGYTGSYAETYAKEEDIPFVAMGDIPTDPSESTDSTTKATDPTTDPTTESTDATTESTTSYIAKNNYNINEIITDTSNTNTYYFYMPDSWKNEYNDTYDGSESSYSAGIYWWSGSYNCLDNLNSSGESWPGYDVSDTVTDNIYVAHVPTDVSTFIWNNTVNGGQDIQADIYTAEMQTTNIPCEYFNANDADDTYGFFPDGLTSFDGMIYVCDPNATAVDSNGKMVFSGSWLYYYGSGKYGTYPTLAEAKAENAVYSNGEFPTQTQSTDPTESTEPSSGITDPTESTSSTDSTDVSDYSGVTGDCTWSFNTATGTLTISGSGNMADYDYYPGTFAPWWSIKEEIKDVVIQDGVKNIGFCAFWMCENLISVTIPNSVTKISESAFMTCKSLTNIIIPDSVTKIGVSAFANCINLTTVIIGNGVKTIDSEAFYYCTSLTSVTIPDSVTSIGSEAFMSCTNLTSITIPKSVKSVAYDAFENCPKLTVYDYKGSTSTYAVKLAVANTKLKVGKTTNAKVYYSTGYETIYSSSNAKVAKISSKGEITALKKGTATIKAKIKYLDGSTITLTKKIRVTSNPKLNKKSVTLKKGKSFKLKVTGLVGKAKFKTNKKKVAKVNSKGKITAKKKGKATITVTANGVKLKCTVKVKK